MVKIVIVVITLVVLMGALSSGDNDPFDQGPNI